MAGKLCLIGYRGLRHEQFFQLLIDAGAFILLDVRRNPYSPNPDYRKEAIEEAAPAYGVKYYHLSQLGAPGAGKSPIPPGAPTTVAEQLATPAAKKALYKIIKLIEADRNVTLMCSEPNYLDCHRPSIVEALQEIYPTLELKRLTAVGEQRLF